MSSTGQRPISMNEDQRPAPDYSRRMSYLQTMFLRPKLNDEIYNHDYPGHGTEEDPYIIDWIQNDHDDPIAFSKGRKWTICSIQAFSFFAVTFGSSVYASGILEIERHFHVSEEVAILGLALYVLGFAIGPILWAPMSEVYGRRVTFVITYTAYLIFTIAAPGAQNIATVLALRFCAAAFGASAQINPGAMIGDLFKIEERGPVMGVFSSAAFLGPAVGPIVGGFVAQSLGWRWTLGINAILSGVAFIAAMLVTVETYRPVILRARARALSRMTGHVYRSRVDTLRPPSTLAREIYTAITRPWVFLVREPIVLTTGLYISIIYATLYMFFAAIPIVFEEERGWNQGLGGLPFVGVVIGVFLALGVCGVDAKKYARDVAAAAAVGKQVEPELRLRNAMTGAIILPVGLFLFAWTTYPSVNWIAPVIGTTLFAMGNVLVFISLLTYISDAYTFYVASAIAANTIMRSFFAAAFPLFTTQMYSNLGTQWASSLPAFLCVGCLPFPFLFYRYGERIRAKCKYAAEAKKLWDAMNNSPEVERTSVKESV